MWDYMCWEGYEFYINWVIFYVGVLVFEWLWYLESCKNWFWNDICIYGGGYGVGCLIVFYVVI